MEAALLPIYFHFNLRSMWETVNTLRGFDPSSYVASEPGMNT